MTYTHFQHLNMSYNRRNSDINLFGRNEKGKYGFTIEGFEPYFYVNEEEVIPEIPEIKRSMPGFKSWDYEDLNNDYLPTTKIFTRVAPDVSKIRNKFKTHYEADIPFTRRFMIDKKLYSGFKVENIDSPKIWHDEIKSSKYTLDPLLSVIDIEVDSPEGFPDPVKADYEIINYCVYDTYYKKYLSFIIEKGQRREKLAPNWYLMRVDNEYELINSFKKYLKRVWPDVLSGYYVDFDITTLRNRAKKNKIKLDFNGISVFDFMPAYTTLSQRSLGKRLKNVIIAEGLRKEEDLVAEAYRNELWEDPKLHSQLIEYNKDDVEFVVIINDRYGGIEFFWAIKDQTGLESINSTLFNSPVIDMDLLRIANDMGYVMPSKPKSYVDKTYDKSKGQTRFS